MKTLHLFLWPKRPSKVILSKTELAKFVVFETTGAVNFNLLFYIKENFLMFTKLPLYKVLIKFEVNLINKKTVGEKIKTSQSKLKFTR